MDTRRVEQSVLVACPDARPPAYQAVVGLAQAGRLREFVTGCYYKRDARLPALLRRAAPATMARLERVLLRRHDAEIPPSRVRTHAGFDVALRLESWVGDARPHLKRALARWRTKQFDQRIARVIARGGTQALLLFSDVGSRAALPLCRRLGIPAVLSMVHGDVREEQQVLATEAAASPEFMPLYLGGTMLDRALLAWFHERRLRDLELADRVLVPSDHIAEELVRNGTPREKLRIVPYAADCARFRPLGAKHHGSSCTFLFAGGISQRKGIRYLLEAWCRIRRPGWKLALLGPLPRELGPLEPYLGLVEPLGRVSHSEMPARMAEADVFVFPSLFEGSAVVTYEALACGLPTVTTPSAGSVVRDGVDGFLVAPRDIAGLAARMEQLGADAALRARMARAARERALAFDWRRYHQAVVAAVDEVAAEMPGGAAGPLQRKPKRQLIAAASG